MLLKTAPQRSATPARLDDSDKFHRDVQFDSRSCRRRSQTADGSPPMRQLQTLSTKTVGGASTPSFLTCSTANEAKKSSSRLRFVDARNCPGWLHTSGIGDEFQLVFIFTPGDWPQYARNTPVLVQR